MSDTVKLIIEIPKAMYESVQNGTYCGTLYKELKNGIPLDDVKAEIEKKAWNTQEIDGEHENYKVVDLSDVLQILDNIGKVESEGI